jgi:hypothetical protein
MSSAYRNNHYVPAWYQREFLVPNGTTRLFYRDLAPRVFRDPKRRVRGSAPAVRSLSPRDCFVERDLYTRRLGAGPVTDIERVIFGKIDDAGRNAMKVFSNFSVGPAIRVAGDLLDFIGAQKLRTPKGLEWLADRYGATTRNERLATMVELRTMYAAVWSECVWQIADASQSETKFIISDHPITVYNRRCGPSSDQCRGSHDPDVRLLASHTIVPLCYDKVLILTNLAWARNPYQEPTDMRPNGRLGRFGFLKLMDIQSERHLSEQEVRTINFIVKSRARRFLGAAVEEWLYPEAHVSKANWADFGDGYLFMPDPRGLSLGGTVITEDMTGNVLGTDEHGRAPGQLGFESQGDVDRAALYRFKGEFSRRFGATRRGRASAVRGDLEPETIGDELFNYYLGQEEPNRLAMKRIQSKGKTA